VTVRFLIGSTVAALFKSALALVTFVTFPTTTASSVRFFILTLSCGQSAT
jgi:hypothetical protein